MEAGRFKDISELVGQLPSNSRLREAIYNDPEEAEYLAALPESNDKWAPSVSEFGLTEHLLTDLIDKFERLSAILMKLNGAKSVDMKPAPRPMTEVQRARDRLRKQGDGELLARWGFSPDDL